MRTLSFFILFTAFVFQLTYSQTSEQLLAKVIDIEPSYPVSFATIRIKDSNKGVIADYNGEFRLPIGYRNKIIIVTAIGFETREINIKELKLGELNIIKINAQIEALDPVFISASTKKVDTKKLIKKSRKLSAKDIVIKAIAEITNNLSNQPHSYIGYYRDYQLVHNKFHNLNEGIIETFDQGINTNFLTNNSNQTAVYSYNQNKNFSIDSTLSSAYDGTTKYIKYSEILPRGGNEHTLLNIHNPIRNYNINTFSYVYNLEKDFPALHKFSKGKIIFLNNEPIIIINIKKIKPRDNIAYGLRTGRLENNEYVNGSLYISLVDYSIHRFNYQVQPPQSKEALFNVSLEYAKYNNKMYLNYITFNNSFEIAEDFVLREELIEYDPKQKAFIVTFNNKEEHLDFSTISRRNFSFKIGKKRLKSLKTKKVSDRKVKVSVENFDKSPIVFNEDDKRDLSYKITRIRDLSGRKIYQRRTLKGNQFREFFVQEVNENKHITDGLVVMDKNLPMIESTINDFPEKNQYWLNSPLMDKKYRD